MKFSLILVVLLLVFKPILPLLDYAVNYQYIAEVLCINKEKPKLECNGKCHLMKEMAKASEAEKPLTSNKKTASSEQEVLFFQSDTTFQTLTTYSVSAAEINTKYSNLYTFCASNTFFHPPTIIS